VPTIHLLRTCRAGVGDSRKAFADNAASPMRLTCDVREPRCGGPARARSAAALAATASGRRNETSKLSGQHRCQLVELGRLCGSAGTKPQRTELLRLAPAGMRRKPKSMRSSRW